MAQNYEINIKRFNGQDFDTLLPTPATHASTHQATGSDPITMQTGNYGDATVTNPKIAPGAVGTSNLQNNATTFAKINKNAKSLSFTNIIVSDQAWEEGGNDPKYPYRAAISLPNNGITGDYFVDIVFDDTEGLANYADSFVDGFYIFAEDYPENLVVIRTADLTPTLPTAFTNDVFASIIVTYQAGKNVSCTDNTTTLNAKTTSGKWTFGVPNAGEWVVSDGTSSQIVNITTQGQSKEIDLRQTLYIIKDGTLQTGFNLNGRLRAEGGQDMSQQSGYIRVYNETSLSNGVAPNVKIDVTGYSKLVIELDVIKLGASNRTGIGLTSRLSVSSYAEVFSSMVVHQSATTTGRQTLECDISGISGEYYPCIFQDVGVNNYADVYVYNFKLVP